MWRVSADDEELIKRLFENVKRSGVGKNVKVVIGERVCPTETVNVNLICGEQRSFIKLRREDVEAAKTSELAGREIELRVKRALQELEGRAKRGGPAVTGR